MEAGRQRGEVTAELVEVGNLTCDQQLGLKQAEERLQRDYIHRLLKVRHAWKSLIFSEEAMLYLVVQVHGFKTHSLKIST